MPNNHRIRNRFINENNPPFVSIQIMRDKFDNLRGIFTVIHVDWMELCGGKEADTEQSTQIMMKSCKKKEKRTTMRNFIDLFRFAVAIGRRYR